MSCVHLFYSGCVVACGCGCDVCGGGGRTHTPFGIEDTTTQLAHDVSAVPVFVESGENLAGVSVSKLPITTTTVPAATHSLTHSLTHPSNIIVKAQTGIRCDGVGVADWGCGVVTNWTAWGSSAKIVVFESETGIRLGTNEKGIDLKKKTICST